MAVPLRALTLSVLLISTVLLTLAGTAFAQSNEAVQGRLQSEGEGVPGVSITVRDADGTESATVETDGDGEWSVPLPGPGDYVVELDQDTLPDDVALRDPDRDVLEVTVRTGQERTVLFSLGEGAVAGALTPEVLQRVLAGLRFGLIIAMTAIGLSLIFGTTGLVNFAHGEMVTFGAIVAWFFNSPAHLGIQLIGAAAIAIVAGMMLGGGIDLGIFRPLRKRRTGLVQMLVISIGLGLFLRFSMLIGFGGNRRPYFDFALQQSLQLGPVRITPRDLTIMVISIAVLVGVATMLQRSRIGKAMRAVADNRDLAESSGIDVQQVILVVWVVGGGLAALGGVMYAMSESVSYLLGFRLLLLIFAGVILGGLGTAYGAMVGSLIIGLVTELSVLFAPTELKFVWALLALILILLVRPQGLLGRAERIG